MSMTSRLYRFFKCCSQIRLIFSTASADFNVDPLTYKRNTNFAWREWDPGCSNSPANPSFRFPVGLLFFGRFFMRVFLNWSVFLSQIQALQQARAVGHVSNDGSDRWRKPSHQGRNCYDLV